MARCFCHTTRAWLAAQSRIASAEEGGHGAGAGIEDGGGIYEQLEDVRCDVVGK